MPKRKPIGWPELMVAKRLRSGLTAYYWSPPTRVLKMAECHLRAEALGTDFVAAKQRCDEILNPQYRAFLRKDVVPRPAASAGSFDWMVSLYKGARQFTTLPKDTRSSYDRALFLVSKYPLTNGRCFGQLSLSSILPGTADKLFDLIKVQRDGTERGRTAVLAMTVCRRAWNVAYRIEPKTVPEKNPFQKMGLSHKSKPTKVFGHFDLKKFVEAADAAGEWSIGTAAMIAFYWLQREVDILERLTWSRYRPAENPGVVMIVHPKTGALVEMPLYDEQGELWPELMARLDNAKRHGTLIVTRDTPDRFKGVRLPWKKRHFLRQVAKVRASAGIDPAIKFMGLRHGGNTEGADANLSDAQLRALSGHKSAAMLVYAKETMSQRKKGARLRLNARTKQGGLSE